MKKKLKVSLIAAIAFIVIAIPAYLIVSGNMAATSIVGVDAEETKKNSADFLKEVGFDEDAFVSKWKSSSEQIRCGTVNENNVYMNYICNEKHNYSNTTIILIPPYGYDYSVMSPIADVMLEKGYNVVMYDQRAHGENNADSFTFGSLESDDLETVINNIQDNSIVKVDIGIIAQGTGASTAAYYMGNPDASRYVDFAILENPYSNAEDKFNVLLNDRKSIIPSSLYRWITQKTIDFRFDFDISSVDIADRISDTDIPVLVMNQSNCSKYPVSSGVNLYDSIKGDNKKIVTFDESEYLKSFYSQNQKYIQTITDFISGY